MVEHSPAAFVFSYRVNEVVDEPVERRLLFTRMSDQMLPGAARVSPLLAAGILKPS
ncbi:MAG: hypothetical protein IMX00_05595 [Limnochordales bacterium]|nr:hypothetical protein [Limnochordales bacterium]